MQFWLYGPFAQLFREQILRFKTCSLNGHRLRLADKLRWNYLCQIALKFMPEPTQTILLVEDDLSTCELYQRELSRDYAVLACDNESEALALLDSHLVSLIVLEPVLQDGQGWSFLAMLHAMPRTRTIPIILCSTLDERRRGMELGATLYLTKPVLPVALHEAVYQVTHSLING